jgi:signal transduction histidine kinase
MSAVISPSASISPAQRRARFAVRGLRTMIACVAIAAMLSGLNDTSFWINLIHSLCIGTCCWLAIDLGRIPLARWQHRNALPGTPEALTQWPGWPLMLVAIVVGTVLGFSIGNELARWITGIASPGFYRGSWRQGAALLIGGLIPGIVITYFYYSREKIAGVEAAAQAAQRQAAEHQLKLLESQLEPHMLFNTLANLRVLIGLDPPRAQLMLDQLIAFLRATLNASRASQHPLSAEFARLADYLALMKIRMGDRLQADFDLPAELAATSLPPLLLQPLVENCIKHGLEPKVAGGRIRVSAAREGADLVLRVRDTGVGLSGVASDGTRFGLVQVRERLATLYGTNASLTLQNAADADDAEGGTLAVVRLPFASLPTSTQAASDPCMPPP